jgi:hypothetical protein
MIRSEAAVLERVAVGLPSAAGAMGKTDQKPSGGQGKSAINPEREGVDKAFDLWLRRGLHQLYDTVAKEPIPENLLRMIEEDRTSRDEK